MLVRLVVVRAPVVFQISWFVTDRLTKLAHFLPVKTKYTVADYAELFMKEIVRLHGVLVSIV